MFIFWRRIYVVRIAHSCLTFCQTATACFWLVSRDYLIEVLFCAAKYLDPCLIFYHIYVGFSQYTFRPYLVDFPVSRGMFVDSDVRILWVLSIIETAVYHALYPLTAGNQEGDVWNLQDEVGYRARVQETQVPCKGHQSQGEIWCKYARSTSPRRSRPRRGMV